jgi:hypothetical protein
VPLVSLLSGGNPADGYGLVHHGLPSSSILSLASCARNRARFLR